MVYEILSRNKKVRVYDSDASKTAGLADAVSLEDALSSQLILLCVPISAMESTCLEMASHLRGGEIVLDTCSVKQKPVNWMLQHLPIETEVLGTHPLFGPDSAKEGIAGLKIVLCPARISKKNYHEISDYLKCLQLVVIEATPEEHDRQIAQNQAVFHLIAQALKRLQWGGMAISTPGPETFYRLVRTVQNDTDQLFWDIERENPHAGECRKQFIQEILRLDSQLASHS